MYNHNRKIIDRLLLRNKGTHKSPCNCRVKDECLMDRNCNSENVVFQDNIFPKEGNFKNKIYFGISTFKWKLIFY